MQLERSFSRWAWSCMAPLSKAVYVFSAPPIDLIRLLFALSTSCRVGNLKLAMLALVSRQTDVLAYSSVASTSSLKSRFRLSFANAEIDFCDNFPMRISFSIFANANHS